MLLSAEKARHIAAGQINKIFKKIEDAAYSGSFQLTLNEYIDTEIYKVLKDYGYKVIYYHDPIYADSPYGQTDEIIGYKDYTIISWQA